MSRKEATIKNLNMSVNEDGSLSFSFKLLPSNRVVDTNDAVIEAGNTLSECFTKFPDHFTNIKLEDFKKGG